MNLEYSLISRLNLIEVHIDRCIRPCKGSVRHAQLGLPNIGQVILADPH